MRTDRRAALHTTLTLALAALAGCAADEPQRAETDQPAEPAREMTAEPMEVVGAVAPPRPREDSQRADAETGEREHFDDFGGLRFDDAVPSPPEYLGHAIGDRFTRHHEIIGYLEAIAEASDRVTISEYGRTHQGRPLVTLTITSPDNQARIDEILDANLELTDPRETSEARASEIIENNPAVAWLSYNVHGNEASCSEAALRVAYTLAAAANDQVRRILENTVVVIDPCINPDGRQRYVSWFENAVGQGGPDPSTDAAEHYEPWPGGRTNHYYFDLNRDWLWMVHPESQARLNRYLAIKPQLHIDVHEQGFRSPYFFGAGDDPYNQNIPAETREWIERYGAANAQVFDERGLVYATKERFDYLYPGYGKVLPVYHGAVGMLVEQAGHAFGGLAVDVHGDYTLTLRERAHHHFLTSMNYVETTAANREGQLRRFWDFHKGATSPENDGPTAFVLSADNDEALMDEVWRLCRGHGVEIHATDSDATLAGLTDYRAGEASEETTVPAGSWVVRADQPMGRLVRALFERKTELTHEETYDITGWSLPIAFGLDAWWSNEPLAIDTTPVDARAAVMPGGVTGDGDYAVVIDADQSTFPVAAGLAVEHDLFARHAGEDIRIDGRDFAMGSLIVHLKRNDPAQIDAFLADLSERGVAARRVGTGMTESGSVLGANRNWLYTLPKVALLRGSPLSSYSFGQIWWLLDLETPFPYTAVNVDDMRSVALDDYNVLVVPEIWGDLSDALGEDQTERLNTWVRDGGTLVAVGSGASWAERAVLELEDEGDDDEAEDESEQRPPANELTYEQRRQRGIDDNIPGAMIATTIDTTHPLSAGSKDWVGVIKRSDRTLRVEDDTHVVGRYHSEPLVSGHLSDWQALQLKNKPFMTHHEHGRGRVILMADDPTIRGFLRAPTRLLLNAIVYGPSL